jgi:hypothetical protein
VRILGLTIGLCLVIGVAIGGCGGSSDATLSKGQFVRQSNALCLTSNETAAGKIEKALKQPEFANAKSEGEGIRAEVSQLVPILITEAEAQHQGINDLGMPDGQEAEVEAILAAYTAWIDKAKSSPMKIVVANDIYNKARELAGKAGLEKCQQTPFQIL